MTDNHTEKALEAKASKKALATNNHAKRITMPGWLFNATPISKIHGW